MNLIHELLNREIARSRRHLSRLIGRAPNYICENKGFRAEDLVHLRLHLIALGHHGDLVPYVEEMLLEPWR